MAAGLVVMTSAAFAGDEAKGGAPDADAMAKWMAVAAPSEAHKKLEAMVGTWDTTVKMWMDPSAPPTETKGVSVNAMVLGGRWLEQRYEGEMMGSPFHGVGYTGYDNYKKQYVGLWMDTASTAAMMTTGAADGGNTMTFTGSMDDPMTGSVCQMKEVVTIVDADHHNFEMWASGPDGQMHKSMEIVYSRKKS
jgi:hypothetical protein